MRETAALNCDCTSVRSARDEDRGDDRGEDRGGGRREDRGEDKGEERGEDRGGDRRKVCVYVAHLERLVDLSLLSVWGGDGVQGQATNLCEIVREENVLRRYPVKKEAKNKTRY